jgi:hypothetical protein
MPASENIFMYIQKWFSGRDGGRMVSEPKRYVEA